jgi:hypothetical protein
MNLFEKIINIIATIIHCTPEDEYKFEYVKYDSCTDCDYKKSNVAVINPVTGLLMIGGVDVAGNFFGTKSSSDDYHRRSQEDCYRSSSSSYYNFSQYDYWKN